MSVSVCSFSADRSSASVSAVGAFVRGRRLGVARLGCSVVSFSFALVTDVRRREGRGEEVASSSFFFVARVRRRVGRGEESSLFSLGRRVLVRLEEVDSSSVVSVAGAAFWGAWERLARVLRRRGGVVEGSASLLVLVGVLSGSVASGASSVEERLPV